MDAITGASSQLKKASSLNATAWVQGLGKVFRRVALFRVEKTDARVVAVHGMGSPRLGSGLSLLDETPLRWSVLAASPIVGAGAAPGGAKVAAALGLSTPRAFAVIPLVVRGRLQALAYVDQANEPLPISSAAELFSFCHRVLTGGGAEEPSAPRYSCRSTVSRAQIRRYRTRTFVPAPTPRPAPPQPDERAPEYLEPNTENIETEKVPVAFPEEEDASPENVAGTFSQPDNASPEHVAGALPGSENAAGRVAEALSGVFSPPTAADASTAEGEVEGAWRADAILELFEDELDDAPAALERQPALQDETSAGVERRETEAGHLAAPEAEALGPRLEDLEGELVVTPDGVISPAEQRAQRRPRRLVQRLVFAAALLSIVSSGAALWPLAPVTDSRAGNELVQIPRNASVPMIAQYLEEHGIIRNARAFRLLARLSGVDRGLRAGAYKLPSGAWAWTVLSELHRGQVHTRTVTIPEGLTLVEVANLLEAENLTNSNELIRAAHSPALLARFGIAGKSAEGFLFPETYTLAKGLSAEEILTVMIDEFRNRLTGIPGAASVSKEDLLRMVTLASIVEREARDAKELPKVAGVFHNRLERGLRLESCATVQYILGEPKARLTLKDIRRPSPYNTYLNPGLPPGPIANPGLGALRAVFKPEEHDYLFFFAREDGSHNHVFSKTFAEHKEKRRRLLGRR